MYQTKWKYKLLLLLLLLLPTFSQAYKAYFGRICVGGEGGGATKTFHGLYTCRNVDNCE